MSDSIIVRQQTELQSKQWGIYQGSQLLEGGFFSRAIANLCAESWRIRIGKRVN